MSDRFGNSEDGFSRVAAHLWLLFSVIAFILQIPSNKYLLFSIIFSIFSSVTNQYFYHCGFYM